MPPAVPPELEHAARHLTQALDDWKAGKHEMALVHLREGITDATWSLYAAAVDEHTMQSWRTVRELDDE